MADLRASTPTDAAKRVIPDVRDEIRGIQALRDRGRYVARAFVERELQGLATARSRPALAAPHRLFDQFGAAVDENLQRIRRGIDHRLSRASDDIGHRLARVQALSPLATLQRGYAVLQTPSGAVVTDASTVSVGDLIEARLATGRLTAEVVTTTDEQASKDTP